MTAAQFQPYFELNADNVFNNITSEYCFKMKSGQEVKMGGSYDTNNEKYFGFIINPYCGGTAAECLARKSITEAAYLAFVNSNTFNLYINENKYDPTVEQLIPGLYAEPLSESFNRLNASHHRT
jgi:hypothetical protein